jgi:hypothetical protein
MVATAQEDGDRGERHRQQRHGTDEPHVTAPDAPPEALTLCRHA